MRIQLLRDAIPLGILIMPQVILKPFGGDLATTDIIGMLAIVCAFFRLKILLPPLGAATLTYLIYAILFFYLNYAFRSADGYESQAPHLLRLVSLYGGIFAAFYFSRSREVFNHKMKIVSVFSVAATAIVIVAYFSGLSIFDAHQTVLYSGESFRINRLGGLPGESGAFGFNTVVVVGLAFTFWIVPERKYKLIKLSALFLLVAVAYQASLTRALLLAFFAFSLTLAASRIVPSVAKIFMVPFSILFLLLAQISPNAISSLSAIAVRFNSLLEGASLAVISSGRTLHWDNIISYISSDLAAFFFGIGHRMVPAQFGHAAENIFIQIFAEYGVLGAGVFLYFLYRLLRPIVFSSRHDDTALAFCCLWVAVFIQWLVNDIGTYYQTFPLLLISTAWFGQVLMSDDRNSSMRDEESTIMDLSNVSEGGYRASS